jgi:hypothetical protein
MNWKPSHTHEGVPIERITTNIGTGKPKGKPKEEAAMLQATHEVKSALFLLKSRIVEWKVKAESLRGLSPGYTQMPTISKVIRDLENSINPYFSQMGGMVGELKANNEQSKGEQ